MTGDISELLECLAMIRQTHFSTSGSSGTGEKLGKLAYKDSVTGSFPCYEVTISGNTLEISSVTKNVDSK